MFIIVVLTVLAIFLLYKWGTSTYDFFEKQGIKYVRPYPFIGTTEWFFMRENIITIAKRYYDQFENEKVYGLFSFRSPFYAIRDPELIKVLTVKEFDHFPHHMDFIDTERDDISENMLPLLKGEKWKEMRTALSPAFTGSKIRLMFGLISEVGQDMSNYFSEQYVKGENLIAYDMKDLFSRFTNDVISTCAFGLKCDSFRNRNNEFFQIGQQILQFDDPIKILKLFMHLIFPKFSRAIGIRAFPKELKDMFYGLIIENMKNRERDNIYRPDMIHLLLQLKRNELKAEMDPLQPGAPQIKTSWTNNELVAQCYAFFQAGFDTTSVTLTFIAYQLATCCDVQCKLLEEIDEAHRNLNGEPINYEKIQSLKYLEMVILETLRMWPPIFVNERECVKDFVYKDDNGLQFKVKKGSFIWIPIQPLHMDKKYFPDPEKFIPERFNGERNYASEGVYMPFGSGPRSCIGNRFAMLAMKTGLYHMLLKFTFEVCPETQVPIKLKNSMAGWVLEKKIKLYLKPRQNQ